MISNSIRAMEEAEANVQTARQWWEKRTWKTWDARPFQLSPAHSKVLLTIAGQRSQGAENYHESPSVFNAALLAIICHRIEELGQEAINHLVLERDQAARLAKIELEEKLAEIGGAQ